MTLEAVVVSSRGVVAGADEPLRLDFFGDTLESIRAFDVASQRTTGNRPQFVMQAMSEVALTPDTISRFRRNYIMVNTISVI